MKAKVIQIQVGGCWICDGLLEACLEYPKCQLTKIHFFIELPNGEHRCITIRDEDNEVVAYGDFEGLPSFLDYAKGTQRGTR